MMNYTLNMLNSQWTMLQLMDLNRNENLKSKTSNSNAPQPLALSPQERWGKVEVPSP